MSRTSVEHLKNEHQQVLRVLVAFQNYLQQSLEENAPDRHELWGVLDALSEGLFLRHEEKEEQILLPELSRHGLSWSGGALAHVRKDHRHGRNLQRDLFQAAHQRDDWSEEDRRRFVSLGNAWVKLLADHMQKEERTLFSYMDTQLSDEEDAHLTKQFEDLDEEFSSMKDAERLQNSINEFVEKFGE